MRALEDNAANWSIDRVATAFRRRELSVPELVQETLKRCKATDDRFGAIESLCEERTLASAAQAQKEFDAGLYRGALHGVPLTYKDIIHTSFAPTRAGGSIHAGFVAEDNAFVVDQLETAGAVSLAKVKTTEGAFVGYAPGDAPPLNAIDRNFWPGASSSGSGVAAAAGLGYPSVASDTGGSIRTPAWCNGATGLKTSWGGVSRSGVFNVAPSLDTVGVIAKSAQDCMAVFEVMSAPDQSDPATLHPAIHHRLMEGVTLGVDPKFCYEGVDSQIVAAIEGALADLRSAGAVRVDAAFPGDPRTHTSWNHILLAEARHVHRAYYPSRAHEYGSVLRGLLDEAETVTLANLIEAFQHRERFAGRIAALFATIDVFVTPVAPILVPSPDGWSAQDTGSERFLGYVNLAGLPSLTLPVGVDSRRMPIAMRLVGSPRTDRLLLALGQTFHSVSVHHNRCA